MKLSRRDVIATGGVVGAVAALGRSRTAWAQVSPGGDTVERIGKSGEMRAVYVVWPPTVIKDPKELSGHFVDAFKFICEEMKVKPVLVEASFGTVIATLQAGRADLSIAATYATIPRAQSVEFSDPIVYLGWNGLVGPKVAKAGHKSPLELDRKEVRIVGVDGAAVTQWVQRTFKNASIHILAAQTEQVTAALEVVSGRADAYLTDDYVIRKFVREHPGKVFELFPEPFRKNAVSWAVRKGDQSMLNFVNVALRNIRDRGLDIEWERKHGADWLHPVQNLVSTSKLSS